MQIEQEVDRPGKQHAADEVAQGHGEQVIEQSTTPSEADHLRMFYAEGHGSRIKSGGCLCAYPTTGI